MGIFRRKQKKEKQQPQTSQQPSQPESRAYESGGQRYGEPGYTQSGQPGPYGQYGTTQQRYDQPQMSQQQTETGYRSGGGGGGYGNPPNRSGSTGYNPTDYGPSSRYTGSSRGGTGDTYGARNERQYENAGSQKRNERYESGRRNDDDVTQGTPGRYPDTYRSGGYDESGGGSLGGRNGPYEGEGGRSGY